MLADFPNVLTRVVCRQNLLYVSRMVPSLVALALVGCTECDCVVQTYTEPPTAEIRSPADGDAVEVGAVISLVGLCTDPVFVPSELMVSWAVDGQAVAAEPLDPDSLTYAEFVPMEPGKLEIHLTVVTPDGLTEWDAISVQVARP